MFFKHLLTQCTKKFSVKSFFSKCDQIRSFMGIYLVVFTEEIVNGLWIIINFDIVFFFPWVLIYNYLMIKLSLIVVVIFIAPLIILFTGTFCIKFYDLSLNIKTFSKNSALLLSLEQCWSDDPWMEYGLHEGQ